MENILEKVEAAIADLRLGKMIILTDHVDRENEGDLIFPAEIIRADIINFMIRHGSGIVCLPLTVERFNSLDLNLMVAAHENSSRCATPFTVSIEAKEGITTGVSAQDRATTILAAVHKGADSLVKPGHIFPLLAKQGGVLERAGHTEGSIDLVKMAGYKPASVICEIMNPDGTMAKGKQLIDFAEQHNLKMLAIDDLITYRLAKENLIAEQVAAQLPIEQYGEFTITVVKEKYFRKEHIVLSNLKTAYTQPVLVRMHSSCMTGDLFASQRCDCHQQLHYSLQKISAEGGLLIYLNQEGRDIGLFNKIKAYALQEQGCDTVQANEKLGLPIDGREYYMAANILRNMGIDSIRLLTNNPVKIAGLKKFGIAEIAREPIPNFNHVYNQQYLQTKKEKFNHYIHF
jgi:3,4-dihydroxy 2-butanone 4-phosphate synthase / GTP cyclohydrolase II